MKERPDVENQLADLDAPVPSIPDLKKKEKERKRSGAVWSGARPGGTSFTGATGGSGAGAAGVEVAGGAARAAGAMGAAGSEAGAFAGAAGSQAGAFAGAAGSEAAAPAGLGWLTGPGGWLSGANASFASKALIGVGVATLMAGLGLYGYLRLHAKPASSGAELGPITDSLKVRRETGDERLNMAGQANHGQILFDDAPQHAADTPAAAEDKKTEPQAPAPDKPADNPWGDILSAAQGPHGFAQSLAGLPSGSNFAGQNMFPSLGAGAGRGGGSSMPSLHYPSKTGKLSGAFARGATNAASASALNTRFAHSTRAFAQLRYARGMSLMAARNSTSEQAMQSAAADAFDQTDTQGGQIAQIDSPVPTSPPGGSGGSGGEYGGGGQTPSIPSDPFAPPVQQPTAPGTVDPGEQQNYQAPMNAIEQLVAEAAKLKMISMILIAAGIALIAAGCACTPFGWGLIAAGIALVAVGVMMLMMANQMASEAQSMSNALQSAYGQQAQQQDVNSCIQQAIANGTSTDQCNTPYNDNNTGNAPTTVSQDVNAEQSSTFEYQNGQPASGQ
jgi:hypothetical protein